MDLYMMEYESQDFNEYTISGELSQGDRQKEYLEIDMSI